MTNNISKFWNTTGWKIAYASILTIGVAMIVMIFS